MKVLFDQSHISHNSLVLPPTEERRALESGEISQGLIQPLTAIALNAEAALRWLNNESVNLCEARQAIARIIKDSQRTGEMIRGLGPCAGWRLPTSD